MSALRWKLPLIFGTGVEWVENGVNCELDFVNTAWMNLGLIDEIKYLGMTLDKKLSYKPDVDKIREETTRNNRTRNYLNQLSFKVLVRNSNIRP